MAAYAFLDTPPRPGAWNMAVDSALMDMVDGGGLALCLRTYMWSPPCVSIGRFQAPEEEVDPDAVRKMGFHLVRRPTGGRAVLHHAELTYSLVADRSLPLVRGSISESLRRVSCVLSSALRDVGAEVTAGPAERHAFEGRKPANPCFTSHGRWEVTTPDGRKLVGSAQARRAGVFLEHGSIILENRQPLMARLLPAGVSAEWRRRIARQLACGTGSLAESAPAATPADVACALRGAFEGALGRRLRKIEAADLDPDAVRAHMEACSLGPSAEAL
jgi:lipoate-protein ligase A